MIRNSKGNTQLPALYLEPCVVHTCDLILHRGFICYDLLHTLNCMGGGEKEQVGSLDPTEVFKISITLQLVQYLLFLLQISHIRMVVLPQAHYETHKIAPRTRRVIEKLILASFEELASNRMRNSPKDNDRLYEHIYIFFENYII